MDSTTTPARKVLTDEDATHRRPGADLEERAVETPRPSILVPHANLWPSGTNPRTRFNEDSIKELAASMVPPVGIIEPLVVRPHPAKPVGHYEIVAGERRWRAAKIAGIIDVPVIVRTLNDAQVLDLQLIENKHRDDIHPLEEARAMERRIKLDRQLTAKGMAKFIGVSERYVQNRLRYLTLTTDAQKVFLDGVITAGHADLLIRLSPDDQRRVLKEGLYVDEWNDGTKTKVLQSVRGLDSWIAELIRITPTDAAQTGLFPDLAAEVAEGHDVATLIEICDSYQYDPKKGEKPPYPLGTGRWQDAKGKACDYQQRAVMVMGRQQGRVMTVCTGHGKCRVHFPYSIPAPKTTSSGSHGSSYKPGPAEVKRREQENVQRALWEKAEKPILSALEAAARKAKPTPATVQLLASYGNKPKTFGELLALHVEEEIYGLDEAARVAKVLGVDLKPILAAAAPKPVAPKKPAPKPKKHKPARAFVKKGARAGVVKALAKKGGKKR